MKLCDRALVYAAFVAAGYNVLQLSRCIFFVSCFHGNLSKRSYRYLAWVGYLLDQVIPFTYNSMFLLFLISFKFTKLYNQEFHLICILYYSVQFLLFFVLLCTKERFGSIFFSHNNDKTCKKQKFLGLDIHILFKPLKSRSTSSG